MSFTPFPFLETGISGISKKRNWFLFSLAALGKIQMDDGYIATVRCLEFPVRRAE